MVWSANAAKRDVKLCLLSRHLWKLVDNVRVTWRPGGPPSGSYMAALKCVHVFFLTI